MIDTVNASGTVTPEAASAEQATEEVNEIAALRERLKANYSEDEQSVTDEPTLDTEGDQTEEPATEEPMVTTAAERAREKLAARKAEREVVRLRKELDEKNALIDRATKDPHEALKLSKLSVKELVERLKTGDLRFDPAAKKDEDPTQARLRLLEEQLADERRNREERAAQDEFQADADAAHSFIEELADEFPLLASVDREWAKRTLVNAARKAGTDSADLNVKELMTEIEAGLARQFKPVVSTKRSISALLKDPESRKLIMEELGMKDPTKKGGNVTPPAKAGTSALSRSLVRSNAQVKDTVTSKASSERPDRGASDDGGTVVSMSELRARLSRLGTA